MIDLLIQDHKNGPLSLCQLRTKKKNRKLREMAIGENSAVIEAEATAPEHGVLSTK